MTGAIELPEGKEMVMPGDNVSITAGMHLIDAQVAQTPEQRQAWRHRRC